MINNEIKLLLYGLNHLIIKYFKEIKDINIDYIVVDNIIIVGDVLKITTLEEQTMELYGKIKEIKII